MKEAARVGAPLEVCGLLAGRDGVVERYFPMTNADAAAEHFSMLPEEQFAAVKEMRRGGLRLLAIWHSHPASPARMSQEDLRLALTPEVIYVITSLAVPPAEELRGYEVHDGQPHEIRITVTEDE